MKLASIFIVRVNPLRYEWSVCGYIPGDPVARRGKGYTLTKWGAAWAVVRFISNQPPAEGDAFKPVEERNEEDTTA